MGLLRVLLALAVVIAHSPTGIGEFRAIPPDLAVQSFYIISGFYMSLVLNTKYATGRRSTLVFYENRFLRLAPTYWLVAFLTLLGMILVRRSLYFHQSEIVPALATLSVFSASVLVLTNLLLVGQDLMMFLAVSPTTGMVRFSADSLREPLPAYKFLIVPQAWTLGVEFAFYLVAPFIVRRHLLLTIGLIVASLALRLFLYSAGLDHDPWTYRFFPNEIALFLAGSLAYRVFRWYNRSAQHRMAERAVFFTVVTAVLAFAYFPWDSEWLRPAFLVLLAGSIPAVFRVTQKSRLDALIGELSYPIYISHLLLLPLTRWAGQQRGVALCIMTLLFAALTVRFVERPIDRIRQRRAGRALKFSEQITTPAPTPASAAW